MNWSVKVIKSELVVRTEIGLQPKQNVSYVSYRRSSLTWTEVQFPFIFNQEKLIHALVSEKAYRLCDESNTVLKILEHNLSTIRTYTAKMILTNEYK